MLFSRTPSITPEQAAAQIAFLCRSGARSNRATRIAAKAGYDAVSVTGGVIAWTRAGLPLAR